MFYGLNFLLLKSPAKPTSDLAKDTHRDSRRDSGVKEMTQTQLWKSGVSNEAD